MTNFEITDRRGKAREVSDEPVLSIAPERVTPELRQIIDARNADTFPEPCQPIGCDNGVHLPGCELAAVDAEDASDEDNAMLAAAMRAADDVSVQDAALLDALKGAFPTREQVDAAIAENNAAIERLARQGIQVGTDAMSAVRLAALCDHLLGGMDDPPRRTFEAMLQHRYAELLADAQSQLDRARLLQGVNGMPTAPLAQPPTNGGRPS